MADSFEPHKRGQAFALYGLVAVLAPSIGPTLGGWITDNFSWRWIFFINIPVGLLSIFLTSTLIHDPPHVARSENVDRVRIDYIGLGLLSVGLGFLQVVLDKGQRDDWFGSNFIVWCTVACAVGLIGAVIWELRQKNPVVELQLFKNRNYATATLLMFLLGVVLYGSTVLLPVMLQTLAGYTAQLSGLVLSPGAMATLISLPLVGWLMARYQPRWLVIFGLMVLSFGMFQLAYINLTTDFWTYVYLWMISRGGLAFLFVPINVTAFSFVPKEKMNNATGLINLARNIGGSVGISLVTTIQARLTQKHQSDLVANLTPLNPRYLAALHGLAAELQARGSSAATAAHQAGALLYGELQRQAAMLAFIDVFWLLGVVCLVMIPLMALVKTPPKHDHEDVPTH